jgi:hypothetical protein
MAGPQHTGNPGNFAEDRAKAARAGHIGGQRSSGNFANDRGRAVEAGRKGGLAGRRPTDDAAGDPERVLPGRSVAFFLDGGYHE